MMRPATSVLQWLCASVLLLLGASGARHKSVSYAALGDSYAAGDGAGSLKLSPPWDATCGRFSDAYPYQLLRSTTITFAQHWPYFEYKACGGATTKSIKWHQRFVLRNKDLVTVQIGGNEVDFFPVLNECVLQWHPRCSCNQELDRARKLIQSTAFVQRFDDTIKGIVSWIRTDDTQIFVLGYARFFNAETPQCNGVSFSLTNPTNVLSNELRRSLNELVVMLNSVIQSSAETNEATYVGIDDVFEGHRFCEVNVTEPHPDWDGTWFFRETSSPDEQLTATSDNLQLPTGAQNYMRQRIPLRRLADLTKTFHPTVQGHEAIASTIIEKLKFAEGAC